jgi:hypothetical protein
MTAKNGSAPQRKNYQLGMDMSFTDEILSLECSLDVTVRYGCGLYIGLMLNFLFLSCGERVTLSSYGVDLCLISRKRHLH